MGTHRFFVGSEYKADARELWFYIVMTVLVGAVAIAIMAHTPEVDDDDARLLLSLFC